jgi:predicted HTH transcriptional regulator
MHRDYHPLAHGTQVRVEMYPDRLVFINPGGLYGSAAPGELLHGAVSSSRNALLARLLEDVQIPGTHRRVCENRGSGLRMVADELAGARLQPPVFRTTPGMFTVEIKNAIGSTAPSAAAFAEARSQARSRTAVAASATAVSGSEPHALSEAESRMSQILSALASGPASSAELASSSGLSRSAINKRLRILEAEELVAPTAARNSPNVRWQLRRTAG